jgi:hypothetical protein
VSERRCGFGLGCGDDLTRVPDAVGFDELNATRGATAT